MSRGEPILVADIGGTNARFAIAARRGDGFVLTQISRVKGEAFAKLEDAVDHYLGTIDEGRPRIGCVAVAGPVKGETVALTNSPWSLTPATFARSLGMERVRVVNDFAALARGAILVDAADRVTVREGRSVPRAPIVVLGPGTGLGLGLLVPDGGAVRVISTEGGHAAFGPCNEAEDVVWRYMRARQEFVSFEDIVSGQGLVNIYRALCEHAGASCAEVSPSHITAAARSADEPIARDAVGLFCSALGTFAGDAVVMTGGLGGVFLGGGILPQIKGLFLASPFLSRFGDRPPISHYLADVPVRLIMSDAAALLGAAALAEEGGNDGLDD